MTQESTALEPTAFASPYPRVKTRRLPSAETSPPEAPPDTFWQVWLAHREGLLRQSLRWMGGHRADAEDALSGAQLRAFARFASTPQVLHPKAWLHRLLHNVCMDIHRKRRRRMTVVEMTPDDSLDNHEPPPNSMASPEKQLLRQELRGKISRSLDALPAPWREAFVGRFLHQRSYRDLARQAGASEANVRKRVQLARDRLQHTLEAQGHHRHRKGRRGRGLGY